MGRIVRDEGGAVCRWWTAVAERRDGGDAVTYRLSGDDATLIAEANTLDAAHSLACLEGGDQIQEGEDGEVTNVDRGNWLPSAIANALGRGGAVSRYAVSVSDSEGNEFVLEADSLAELSALLKEAGYEGSSIRVTNEPGFTIGWVSADGWRAT
jgi:hypothetical protein